MDFAEKLRRLKEITDRLRGEGGCPWDREQTLSSIKGYTIEEAYELADAIESGDNKHIVEELGDLLHHVFFYSRLLEEEKRGTLDQVVEGIIEKLIKRHPHVFKETEYAKTAVEALRKWEEKKVKDKDGLLDGVPRNLPALIEAEKISKRAACVGFDWNDKDGVVKKLKEEFGELLDALKDGKKSEISEEIGDLFFILVNLCRFYDLCAENCLREANLKFRRRFSFIEKRLQKNGKRVIDESMETLDALWEEAKRSEKGSSKNMYNR